MTLSVKIGTNPIAWSNDDKKELGGETPLETCLSEARLAGYTGIELGNKFPRDAETLRPILSTYGLGLISGWYSSNLLERSVDEEIEALEAHLTLLKAMGCPVIVWAETTGCIHGNEEAPLAARPTISDAEWPRFCEKLSTLGKHVASHGMKLAYHHHMGTVIETDADITRMMDGCTEDVWLLLDTGHLTFAGIDPESIARKYANRIAHVHCKDVRKATMQTALENNSSFLSAVIDGVFTVPGDGHVVFEPVLKILHAGGYEGWLVVEAEQDPAKANPLEYATLGHKNLSTFASNAGYRIEG